MKFLISVVAAASILAIAPAYADTSPMTVQGAATVTVDEAASLFDAGTAFVDVRSDSDFEAGRIPGAVHLELNNVFTEEALLGVVDKDEAVVLYCNGESCLRSSEASVKAVEWGFTDVHYFRDGFPAWDAAGHPVE